MMENLIYLVLTCEDDNQQSLISRYVGMYLHQYLVENNSQIVGIQWVFWRYFGGILTVFDGAGNNVCGGDISWF